MTDGTLTQLELDGIRTDQEAQLDATCMIWRVHSEGTISKVDATLSSPVQVTIYTGVCYVTPIVARRDRFEADLSEPVPSLASLRCRTPQLLHPNWRLYPHYRIPGPRFPTQGHDRQGCVAGLRHLTAPTYHY